MKPIKTEYMNVVFDSKAEAVFARSLHLAGKEWVYHPVEICGHVWDFIVLRVFECEILVEYKPAMPTNTYIENLTEQMRPMPMESIIVWGNPWQGLDPRVEYGKWGPACCYVAYPIFSTHDSRYGWGNFCALADNGAGLPFSYRYRIESILGITEDMAQEAKEYRFDLA